MMIDLEREVITFKAFGRSMRKKDLLVKTLEHGWVKESPSRIKVFNSMPKGLDKSTKLLEHMTLGGINPNEYGKSVLAGCRIMWGK